jgi:flagellar biosynthetic protein FliO
MPTSSASNLNLPFTLLALVSVLVLAWFIIRLLARIGIGKTSSNSRLRIRQSVPIGARERLVLLEFDGNEYLLGVTAGSISVLERNIVAVSPLPPDQHTVTPSPHSDSK